MTADHDHDDDHGHSHYDTPGSRRARSQLELRAMALEAALVENGVIHTDAIDFFTDAMEHRFGPHHGARVVARAWTDSAFKQRLLDDGNAAVAELGIGGLEGNVRVVENTPGTHNMVVCTLCSCYPWPLLGLPPLWYKSFAYRSRAVAEPRAVLREFGVELDDSVRLQVWDSSSEVRYFVLPDRPEGTEGMSEDELAALIDRNAMIGTGLVSLP
ncbi:MAG: nitrile hydratase subunit alpha [Actinobacteria bacterium]|jgi:nitrile hydratase|nr:nitrile hydratase subunit alpha [Actinomycetota bacterium]